MITTDASPLMHRREVDHHRPAPGAKRLHEIFRLETARVLGTDRVVRHENPFYQMEGQSRNYAPAKSKVLVCEWEEGTMEIHYRGLKLNWREIQERPQQQEVVHAPTRHKRSTPPAIKMPDHPWRRGYRDMEPLGTLTGSGANAPISVDSALASA